MNKIVEQVENLTEEQLKIVTAIKNNIIANYDYDLTEKRCRKTGKLQGYLTDSELLNLFNSSNYDLVKTCEKIEKNFTFNNSYLADWIYTDTETLDYHRQASPREFMFFAIKKLMESSLEYLPYKSKDNFRLTSEGQFLFDCDFCRFASELDDYKFTDDELTKINNKLVLFLSLAGLSTCEKLNNLSLSSFDKIKLLIIDGKFINALTDMVSFLINKFKLRYALSDAQELTLRDIELIRQAHRKKKLDEETEKNNAIKIFRELKRYKDNFGYLDNIIGELYLTQQDSFKRELQARRALPLAEKINKGLVKFDDSGKMEEITSKSNLSQLTKIKLTSKIIIRKKEQ